MVAEHVDDGEGELLARVRAVVDLLAQEATVPFIARYRKEATGSLDEVAVAAIRDRMDELHQLQDRRAAILQSLETHGHLTEALTQMVLAAETMAALEDIYLPFRPKRRTRAMAAREKGLDPLAMMLLAQSGLDPEHAAATFVNPELGVASAHWRVSASTVGAPRSNGTSGSLTVTIGSSWR